MTAKQNSFNKLNMFTVWGISFLNQMINGHGNGFKQHTKSQTEHVVNCVCESIIRRCIHFHSTVWSGLKCIQSIQCGCVCMSHYMWFIIKELRRLKKLRNANVLYFSFFRLFFKSRTRNGYKVQLTTETPKSYKICVAFYVHSPHLLVANGHHIGRHHFESYLFYYVH